MICSYCLGPAEFILKNGKPCCKPSANSCPTNRNKNSERTLAKAKERDYPAVYSNIPQEVKDRMSWNRGLTKETHPSLASKQKGKQVPLEKRYKHTEEFKRWQSKRQSEFLKSLKDKKRFIRKTSWLEQSFIIWLERNKIEGWKREVHFWNDELRKNYFVDFLFEELKLIVELDGTQHRWSEEQDTIRDAWLNKLGYFVVRIKYEEFIDRFFSEKGFNDLIRACGEIGSTHRI